MQQKELFELIFQDAHLVDVDLSAWDKYIALYVMADHAGRTKSGRKPMFVVEFIRVRSLHVVFNHLSYDPPIEMRPDEHVQWLFDRWEIEPDEESLRITLWALAHPAGPRLTLVCKDISIREMSYDTIDRLFPEWSSPSSGFIRPGLDAMVRDY